MDSISHCERVEARPFLLGVFFPTMSSGWIMSRAAWKQNCEDERLLGVHITGQPDHTVSRSHYRRRNDFAWHELVRFRLRGLWKVNVEALVIATRQNLRRLLNQWG